jgi:hypothetical protein
MTQHLRIPAGHKTQSLSWSMPRVVENFPAPQSIHVLASEAPAVSEYLPVGQGVHGSLPAVPLYVPEQVHMGMSVCYKVHKS